MKWKFWKKENFPIQKKKGKKINSVIKHKLNGDYGNVDLMANILKDIGQ